MKTALTELIETLNAHIVKGSNEPIVENNNAVLRMAIHKATELLEKEREQIEKARKNGRESMISSNSEIAFKTDEQYYNETFKQ